MRVRVHVCICAWFVCACVHACTHRCMYVYVVVHILSNSTCLSVALKPRATACRKADAPVFWYKNCMSIQYIYIHTHTYTYTIYKHTPYLHTPCADITKCTHVYFLQKRPVLLCSDRKIDEFTIHIYIHIYIYLYYTYIYIQIYIYTYAIYTNIIYRYD